eukprot:TRINITY_DN10273_c0_g1_i2.p1 TRINITY_DN10273_c0_g1~~TRINITY_DN10273_c0_g1_i2.p1  ORF type:complete len:896 (-),score=148.72 TRINITY_DN10273_c0_g1_i2:147-2834(-)
MGNCCASGVPADSDAHRGKRFKGIVFGSKPDVIDASMVKDSLDAIAASTQAIVQDGAVEAGRSQSSSSRSSSDHPVLEASPCFQECLSLVRANKLKSMSVPWSRSQDLDMQHFKVPKANDLVVSISHAWPFQAHPDPEGKKADMINSHLSEIYDQMKPPGEVLCFFDFCSVTQRPFREGQQDRTEEQSMAFGDALTAMPQVYLLSDAVLHLDMGAWSPTTEVEQVFLDASDLYGDIQFVKVGECIQAFCHGHPHVKLFDTVVSVGGTPAEDILDVKDLKRLIADASNSQTCCVVELARHPMGRPNKVPTGDRGWIYLERFVTMIKCAMVNESDFDRICFSNNQAVLEEIRSGSNRLRAASLASECRLRQELNFFLDQLNSKKFSAASTDAALTVSTIHSNLNTPASENEATTSDRDIIASIMLDTVKDLNSYWTKTQQRQQQRQLFLAVGRQDVAAVDEILRARAEVNCPGFRDQTALHVAAKMSALDVARSLLKFRADVSLQDARSNLPAHLFGLTMRPGTIEIFELLAPGPEQLGMANEAGAKPARRFEAWAKTCQDGGPYQPALDKVQELKKLWPAAFEKRTVPNPKRFSRMQAGLSVLRSVTQIRVGALDLAVDTWQSCDPKGGDGLKVIVTPSMAPWLLVSENMDALVRGLCDRLPLNVFVLNEFSFPFSSMATEGISFIQLLEKIVIALVHCEPFVFIDCSTFSAAAYLKMGSQLLGVVCACGTCAFTEDVRHSDAFHRFRRYAQSNLERANMKDSALLHEYLGARVFGGLDPEHLSALKRKTEAALPNLPDQSWDMIVANHEIFLGEVWIIDALPPLYTLPSLIILGDSASPLFRVEPAECMKQIWLPRAQIHYIEDSNAWWFLEAEDQLRSVSDLLYTFLRTVAESK